VPVAITATAAGLTASPGIAATARRHAGVGALLVYCLLAFLYFGLRLLVEPGSHYVGVFADPQIPIWSFAWWPYAIGHGENPFVTHVVWAPVGVDLAWVNTLPPVAIVLAPLTLLAGPVVTYNVAAIALPALAAWCAYLLCQHLTRSFWASLVGGYLFGFSSYVIGHVVGQPQLTAVFTLPLLALVVLKGLEGGLGSRALAASIAGIVALQVYLSMELAFTMTLALVGALALGYAVGRGARPRIAALLPRLAAGYLLAAVLSAPMLYYALTAVRIAGFQPPGQYVADLANLVVPTHLVVSGAGWASSVTRSFPGNDSEQGSLLGVPLLLIIALFARRNARSQGGRFLLLAAALTIYFSLGPELTIDGHRLLPLPTPFGHNSLDLPGVGRKYLPLLDNTLPARFALYTALAVCVIAARWIAGHPGGRAIRIGLPIAAIAFLVPNPAAGVWSTSYSLPAFFSDPAYRSCLAPGELVLPQPIAGQFNLWQALDDFRFRLAGGRLQTSPPSPFLHPAKTEQISVGYPPIADQSRLLRDYIEREGVEAVILDKREAAIWGPSLDRIARPLDVGGVTLYRVSARAPACRVSRAVR
jgi:hypothetical protein